MTVDTKLSQAGAIFYDIEIIAAIPMKGEKKDPALFYCEGWGDHKHMGISMISVYDYVEQAYRIYLQDNLNEFNELIKERNIVMGFNNIRFDDKVVRCNGIDLPKHKSYDLYKTIMKTQQYGQGCSFSLNSLLTANNIKGKSGHGSDAPALAQHGQWGKLINYGMDDTRKSIQLVRLALSNNLKHPGNGSIMTVEVPWSN